MRILVTGSSGQLGQKITQELQAAGHKVIGLDPIPGPYTTQQGSVTDRELVTALVAEVDAVIHTASLHAPHVAQITREQFIDVNIKGTLYLLEAAVRYQIQRFVYTSTTSLYGRAMIPQHKAVWVTEALQPIPRDIYDITKLAAEHLCEDFARQHQLPVICLRTSRFWDEPPALRAIYRLYRGVDVRDVVAAHLLALNNTSIPFGVFNISARSPFVEADSEALLHDAPAVIRRCFPTAEDAFARQGWTLPPSIDRVYVIDKAEKELGYDPQYNFAEML
ncbi:MAG TPA: NAD(P)-dependent oxidoreductase [Aggregatilineaceae bacterium]|nr:NAD(P)-dependent oxidoreductase [Aggregatilineaceae bacterium]